MKFKSFTYLLLSALMLLGYACSNTSKVAHNDFAPRYNPEMSKIKPTYNIYHLSDTQSRVQFAIYTSDLLYAKMDGDSIFRAKVNVKYKLLEGKVLADSGTVVVENKSADENFESKVINGYFDLSTQKKNYTLQLITKDLYRNTTVIENIQLNKLEANHRQYFQSSKNADLSVPNYTNMINVGDTLFIAKNTGDKKLKVRYFFIESELPPPPFSIYTPKSTSFKPDTSYVLESGNGIHSFVFTRPGLYHFTVDTAKAGLSIVCFDGGYPKLKSANDLASPLRYITSKKEYTEIVEAENPKQAIDQFWLNLNSDKDRAKELIKNYYSRIEFSNEHFTSFQEGWKTDRGLIYTIFGPPNAVYQSEESETWVYGEENNFLSMSYYFTRVKNPFTDNDFLLNRNPNLKNHWYNAVDSWRQGRVFTVKPQ